MTFREIHEEFVPGIAKSKQKEIYSFSSPLIIAHITLMNLTSSPHCNKTVFTLYQLRNQVENTIPH